MILRFLFLMTFFFLFLLARLFLSPFFVKIKLLGDGGQILGGGGMYPHPPGFAALGKSMSPVSSL